MNHRREKVIADLCVLIGGIVVAIGLWSLGYL
jgi:hypothetical protein